MTKRTEVLVKCGDNCSAMSVDRFDGEGEEYYVTFYNSYEDCSWFKKIKTIWKVLKGRNIHNSEIILSPEEYNKLRNFK